METFITQIMEHPILFAYAVGSVLAFILGFMKMNSDYNAGKNVDEAPAVIASLALVSWFGVACLISFKIRKV